MINEICIHNGVSPVSLLDTLPNSQAGSGRHKCPTCAYEQGFVAGSNSTGLDYEEFCSRLIDGEICKHGSLAPSSVLQSLGENQGGTGRHKCTNCAFKEGFIVGQLVATDDGIPLTIEHSYQLNQVPAPNLLSKDISSKGRPKKVNFIELETKNKKLGYQGELLVLKREIDFLNSNGKPELAKKIKHVSVDVGDSEGYDILSFELDGSKKYIEVKTTRANISREFFLTQNELLKSIEKLGSYFLYRVFDVDTKLNKASFYIIDGDLREKLKLKPIVFSAFPVFKVT